MDVQQLLNTKEDLHMDLVPYVSDKPVSMLRHPLIYSLFYTPNENALLNKQYEHKKKRVQECFDKKDWDGYVFMHERPYRLEAFLNVRTFLNDEEYWRMLGEIWVDSENIWQNKKTWKSLLSSKRPMKMNFMDEDERKALNDLPDELVIYRGCCEKNKNGYSYTLDKEKATWFSKRFPVGKPSVIERKINLKKVHYSETFGNKSKCVIEIQVDAGEREFTEDEKNAFYEASRNIQQAVSKSNYALNQEYKKDGEENTQRLIELFGNKKIFVEKIQNEYYADDVHNPWLIVTTDKGHIKIGWRKKVINIDWKNTTVDAEAKDLFPDEDVTKGDKSIHAWGYAKAKEYLYKILNHGTNK